MKKNIIWVLGALLAVSCAVQEQQALTELAPEGYKVLTIKADTGIATKTSYAGETTFSWSVGDKISVLCNDGSTNFWQTFTAQTAAKASVFKATVPANVNMGPKEDGKYKVALFPASEDHVYTGQDNIAFNIPATKEFRSAQGGHPSADIPMMAWGTASDVYKFSNLTGAVKFTFSGVPTSTAKFVFTAGVKLNGTFNLFRDGDIDVDNSSNYRWNPANTDVASEKTVTSYADVTDGTVSFYVPYAGSGTLWSGCKVKLFDPETDAELFNETTTKDIVITKNQVVVVPVQNTGFTSAYGIDWSGVSAASNAHATYQALKTLKITADDNYIYWYMEVDPSKMSTEDKYNGLFHFYRADASADKSGYWGSATYSEIDASHDKWASKNGSIYYSVYGSSAYASNLKVFLDTWYYEIRMARSLDAALSGVGTVNLGVMLDATAVDSGDNWVNTNSWNPYGVIPTYGTSMYTLDLPSTLNLSFTEASGEVSNPERGLYDQQSFHFDGGIPSATLWDLPQNLILVLFYLEDFRESDLSAAALTTISSVFSNIRAAGKKAIVRFGYTDEHTEDSKPWDAGITQIRAHIAQVKDILSDNQDIIYVLQAGFVGTYGEWYYTSDDFSYSVSDGAVTGYENRAQVITDLLAAVPDRQVGLRTAKYKRYFLSPLAVNEWTPIASWGTSDNQRLGFFNDGFRGSSSDVGTFESDVDRTMWNSQSAWLVTGGETAYPTKEDKASKEAWLAANPSLASLDNAITEIRNQHFSYLNANDNNLFMDYWDGDSHGELGSGESRIPELQKALGYRLVLDSAAFSFPSLASGSTVGYGIEIENTGSAPVIYPRPLKLMLLHAEGDPDVLVDNLADVRTIAPGASATSLSGSFDLPVDVVAGDKLAIWLPDNAAGLQSNAAYSIRLANDEVTWSSGYNVIYTF